MKPVLLGVALGACGMSSNTTLAQIPQAVIRIDLYPETDDNDDDIIQTHVTLQVYKDVPDSDAPPQCPTIDDDPATFDQTSIDITNQGQEGDFDGCIWPYWDTTLPLGPQAGTSISLPDGFGATFPPGVLGARIAHLTAGHPWSFHAGETFQLTWSSADDLATLALVDVIASWSTGGTTVPLENIANDATTITLQMPDPLPTGDGTFEVLLDHDIDHTPSSCTGATRCEASNPLRFDHVAHVD
jgi:hypothetical protein